MPITDVIIYQDKTGTVPLLQWMDNLPGAVKIKCIEKIELLAEFGFDLRRPHCDILESGIYELRARRRNVNYRILYCFVGQNRVLLSHGCIKEAEIEKIEIIRALQNQKAYLQNPGAHTYKGEW
jgi:phage-related protein